MIRASQVPRHIIANLYRLLLLIKNGRLAVRSHKDRRARRPAYYLHLRQRRIARGVPLVVSLYTPPAIASLPNISKDTVEQQINLSMKHLRKELSKKMLPLLALVALIEELCKYFQSAN